MYLDFLSILLCLLHIYLIVFLYSRTQGFKSKKLSANLLFLALTIKFLGTFFFCFVYMNIYKTGDTIYYHNSAAMVAEYFWTEPIEFFKIWLNGESYSPGGLFYRVSEAPAQLYNNVTYNLNLVKWTVPFELLSFGNFYAASLWLSFLAFTGIWKLYELLIYLFKKHRLILSLILFVPSILFWTGGILKDTFIIAAVCWTVYCTFQLIVLNRIRIRYLLSILIALILIMSLKPYVVIVLIPCLLVWMALELIKKLNDKLIMALLSPVSLFVAVLLVTLLYNLFQQKLGAYGNYEELLEYSQSIRRGFDATNQRSLIGGSDYHGEFSIKSGLTAFTTVMYRPFLWEAWDKLSFIAAIENLFILLFFILSLLLLLFDLKSTRIFIKKPFLLFCLFYSLIFAIGLGISISNFGAIVRLKSAFTLFYLIPILLITSQARRKFDSLI